MKLNKICLIILILLSFNIVSCNNNNTNNIADNTSNDLESKFINIVDKMSDGLESELIQKLYDEDIRNVYEWTNSKHIDIWYYEVDLNDNGYNDIITIVSSPLHSGSHGDSVDIWINDGNGEYQEVSGLSVARILSHDPEYNNGEIYISNEKTNGFRNINIICQSNINLIYRDGRYEIN